MLFLMAAVLLVTSVPVRAGQEFRAIDSIASPKNPAGSNAILGEGYGRVEAQQPVPQDVVEKAVREIFTAWNTSQLASVLDESLPNKQRILDSINAGVPDEVKLIILSIQNPRTLEQYARPHPDKDGAQQVLSKVAVRVRVEVAFSSQFFRRFQRIEGTSEYLISITQKVK